MCRRFPPTSKRRKLDISSAYTSTVGSDEGEVGRRPRRGREAQALDFVMQVAGSTTSQKSPPPPVASVRTVDTPDHGEIEEERSSVSHASPRGARTLLREDGPWTSCRSRSPSSTETRRRTRRATPALEELKRLKASRRDLVFKAWLLKNGVVTCVAEPLGGTSQPAVCLCRGGGPSSNAETTGGIMSTCVLQQDREASSSRCSRKVWIWTTRRARRVLSADVFRSLKLTAMTCRWSRPARLGSFGLDALRPQETPPAKKQGRLRAVVRARNHVNAVATRRAATEGSDR